MSMILRVEIPTPTILMQRRRMCPTFRKSPTEGKLPLHYL